MLLTLPATVSIVVVTLAVFMGTSSAWVGITMNQPRERMQAAIAFSAAWYAFFEIPLTLDGNQEFLVAGMRLQLLGTAIHVITWMRYAHIVRFHGVEEPPIGRLQRGYEFVVMALAIACNNPAWSYTYPVEMREVAWLQVVYRDVIPTPLNSLTFAVLLLGLLIAAGSFILSARAGVREAIPNFIAVCFLFVAGAIDATTVSGYLEAPYLLSLGLFSSVCVSWLVVTRRFIGHARSSESTSIQLAETVETRTAALNRTHEELQRAERLAGLGRLAAGVAHEINNPSAVVMSNLQYVIEELGDDAHDIDDIVDALERALRQMRRVEGIVGDMLVTGRVAGSRDSMNQASSVRELVESAIEAEDLGTVRLEVDIPYRLSVIGHERLLFPVIRNLIANARDAVAENRGTVTIRGVDAGERVILTVEDNGPGMSPEIAQRIFEPFFTTKAPGEGTGMGLSVSLGMVGTVGGELTCESTLGKGTIMTLRLYKPRPTRHTPVPILRAIKRPTGD